MNTLMKRHSCYDALKALESKLIKEGIEPVKDHEGRKQLKGKLNIDGREVTIQIFEDIPVATLYAKDFYINTYIGRVSGKEDYYGSYRNWNPPAKMNPDFIEIPEIKNIIETLSKAA